MVGGRRLGLPSAHSGQAASEFLREQVLGRSRSESRDRAAPAPASARGLALYLAHHVSSEERESICLGARKPLPLTSQVRSGQTTGSPQRRGSL